MQIHHYDGAYANIQQIGKIELHNYLLQCLLDMLTSSAIELRPL